MCRLLAFSFHKDTPKDSRLSFVNSFKALSEHGAVLPTSEPGHTDGWGIVVYPANSDVPVLHKSIYSAHLDETFNHEAFFDEGVSQSGLIHLRKKTVGDKLLSNTHPFIEGMFSFIHNGTVSHLESYPTLAPSCVGSTDSERLFKRFIEIKNNEAMKTIDAFIKMLKEAQELYPEYSAINTILHDGEHIFASRVINLQNSSYSESELHTYYTLHVGTTPIGDVVISSEEIPHQSISYSLLPNNSVSRIRLCDGEVQTFLLV